MDPRHPRAPRASGDNVPLLPIRRASLSRNIWAGDTDDQSLAGTESGRLLARASNEVVFEHFLEDDEDEEPHVRRASGASMDRKTRDSIAGKRSLDKLIEKRLVYYPFDVVNLVEIPVRPKFAGWFVVFGVPAQPR